MPDHERWNGELELNMVWILANQNVRVWATTISDISQLRSVLLHLLLLGLETTLLLLETNPLSLYSHLARAD